MLLGRSLRIKIIGSLVLTLLALGVWLGQRALPAAASPLSQSAAPTPNPLLSISDEACLQCHGQPGPTYTLPSGEILDLYVSVEDYTASVHGYHGYACVQCHTTVGSYPHPRFFAETLRDVSLQLSRTCKQCHIQQYAEAGDSVHAAAQVSGNDEAATCVDCHGAHNVRQLTNSETHQLTSEARQWIPETCARCHSAIYEKYRATVHGKALTENNADVPTCIDCHGVHDIPDPRTGAFRLRSPEICAKCHTDEVKMAKYGLSTHVLTTYVADFHGTTVELFEKRTPDADTNKAVCYDCHGIHEIQSTRDPNMGLSLQENLLHRCQVCHPDATANFPAAWLSHYEPSADKFPIVYYVNLFYSFFIPTLLGGMGLLVMLDMFKAFRVRMQAAEHAPTSQGVAHQEQVPSAPPPAEHSQDNEEAKDE